MRHTPPILPLEVGTLSRRLSNRTIFEPTEDIRAYLAYAIFALAGAHMLAALWHQFILHDGVLGRIWPALQRR